MATKPATAAAAAPAAAKPAAGPRGPKGIPLDGKIRFGSHAVKDDKGVETTVHYGPKHNPKRDGTKAAARFSNYKDGMTVAKALEFSKPRHITKDVGKGFISIEGGTATE